VAHNWTGLNGELTVKIMLGIGDGLGRGLGARAHISVVVRLTGEQSERSMISSAGYFPRRHTCVARSITPPSRRPRLVLHKCALSPSKPPVTMLSKAASHKPIGTVHLHFTGQPIYTHARPPSVVHLPRHNRHPLIPPTKMHGAPVTTHRTSLDGFWKGVL